MRKLFIVTGALAALGGLAVVAGAEVTQTFTVSTPPAKAGKPMAFNVKFTTSDTTEPQPPVLQRVVIRLNKGGKFNGKNFPNCKKNTLVNTSKCPSKSKIGSGSGTGSALPIVALVNGKLTLYNGEKKGKEIYVYTVPDIGPNFLTVGKVSKKKSGPYDYNLDFGIPPIQTLPGAPDASVTSVSTKTPIKYVKKRKKGKTTKIPLIVAPKKCTGKWVGEAEFHYATGEVKSVQGQVKCKKK